MACKAPIGWQRNGRPLSGDLAAMAFVNGGQLLQRWTSEYFLDTPLSSTRVTMNSWPDGAIPARSMVTGWWVGGGRLRW